MVVAVLVGDRHAHAWAFDRSSFIGYPLPPPAEIVTAVERIAAYASQKDRAGVQRIADDLIPAVLGPVMDRLSMLKRVILVMDGPLRQLSAGDLHLAVRASSGSDLPSVVTVDDGALLTRLGDRHQRRRRSFRAAAHHSAGERDRPCPLDSWGCGRGQAAIVNPLARRRLRGPS